MKGFVFLAVLLSLAPFATSQCNATISSSDTVGDVKRKLSCLSSENLKLKQDLAQAQSQATQLKQDLTQAQSQAAQWGISLSGVSIPPAVDTCKSRATESIIKRGGALVYPGAFWVDSRIGPDVVKVICHSEYVAFISVAGPNYSEVNDLSNLLRSEIFP
jgi:hypothetical protein